MAHIDAQGQRGRRQQAALLLIGLSMAVKARSLTALRPSLIIINATDPTRTPEPPESARPPLTEGKELFVDQDPFKVLCRGSASSIFHFTESLSHGTTVP